MKRLLPIFLLVGCFFGFSQAEKPVKKYTLDISQFNGSILLHNPDISHLITAHPGGIIVGFNRKRYGHEDWEAEYGYPDTGFSFVYQNMNNPTLGQNFGLYAHYNFYFFKRNLQFRIGQGIAYNTNPYDKNTNFRNNAYGTHLLRSASPRVHPSAAVVASLGPFASHAPLATFNGGWGGFEEQQDFRTDSPTIAHLQAGSLSISATRCGRGTAVRGRAGNQPPVNSTLRSDSLPS